MMPYFDGREEGVSDDTLRRVRNQLESDEWHNADSVVTGQDVDVEAFGPGQGRVVTAGVSTRYVYPRPATVELARELYLSGDLSEREFEDTLERVFEREGVEWGEPEVEQ